MYLYTTEIYIYIRTHKIKKNNFNKMLFYVYNIQYCKLIFKISICIQCTLSYMTQQHKKAAIQWQYQYLLI